jgi:deoxyribonuclease V
MQIRRLHEWRSISVQDAIILQRQLAGQVIRQDQIGRVRYIMGVDVSVDRKIDAATAAAVVLSYPDLTLIEAQVAEGKVEFPYVPGLLSFREIPLTLVVCEKIAIIPDLVMVDGQGIAHPRRMGLASHLGLFLDIPTIGCAKSPLYGKYDIPPEELGSYTEIRAVGNEIIGAAVRTKTGSKPLIISTGHKISLESSVRWVLQSIRGYRLPEPTRLAHLASRHNLPPEYLMNKPQARNEN